MFLHTLPSLKNEESTDFSLHKAKPYIHFGMLLYHSEVAFGCSSAHIWQLCLLVWLKVWIMSLSLYMILLITSFCMTLWSSCHSFMSCMFLIFLLKKHWNVVGSFFYVWSVALYYCCFWCVQLVTNTMAGCLGICSVACWICCTVFTVMDGVHETFLSVTHPILWNLLTNV